MEEPKKCELLIIGESPSDADDKNGSVMRGYDFKILNSVLTDVIGADESLVHKTFLVKCKPEKKVTKEAVSICPDTYLQKELEICKPKLIVTLGDQVMQSITGLKGIKTQRGKFVEAELYGKPYLIMPIFSSGFAQAHSNNLELFANDLNKAYGYAAGLNDGNVKYSKWVLVDSYEKALELVEYIKETGVCAFDFETDILDKMMGTFKEGFKATMLSISFQIGSGWVIPLNVKNSPLSEQEQWEIMELLIREVFEDSSIRKIAHHLRFDFHVLSCCYGGKKLLGRIDDTMLMSHLINELDKKGLDDLTRRYYPAFDGYWNKVMSVGYDKSTLEDLAEYNATDTDITLRCCLTMETILLEDERVYRIYRNLSMGVFRSLWEAESRGADIDVEQLEKNISELSIVIEEQHNKLLSYPQVVRFERAREEETVEEAIQSLRNRIDGTGEDGKKVTATNAQKYEQKILDMKTGKLKIYEGINFGSWQQVEELLYFHKKGFRFNNQDGGTGKDILEELEDKTGFVADLLLYRSLKKIHGTYLEGLWKRLDSNYKVHTTLKIDGTVSGRLSSRNPNLQNIPSIDKLGNEVAKRAVKMVKQVFKVRDGYTMIQLDYAQAELRVMAAFAQDTTMLDAYSRGLDLHTLTAANMMRITVEEFKELPKDVQKLKRFQAKAANFGLIYGISAFGFKMYAKDNYKLILTDKEATEIRQLFFDTYSELPVYHATYKAKARKFGWVRTLYGRKRRTPDIDSIDDFKRGEVS